MPPVVSVILLIGDSSRSSVIESINSLFEQTVNQLEIIIVSAGSTGYGVSIGLQEDYSNNRTISFVNIPEDVYSANYRNYVLRYVHCKYVCFMNGGEIWAPDKLKRQVCIFESDDSISAVVCNGTYTLSDGKDVSGGLFFDLMHEGPSQWIINCPVCTPGQVLYKNEAIKRISSSTNLFYYLSDMDAICRMSGDGRVFFDETQSVKCFILDNKLRKRSQFLEYEKLIFVRYYIDIMLSDKTCFYSYYHNLVLLALKANFVIEAIQYSAISFIRFPIINIKKLFIWAVGYILFIIRSYNNKRLLNSYVKDIRKSILGIMKTSFEHKYNLLNAGNGNIFANTHIKSNNTIKAFQYAGKNIGEVFTVPAGIQRICEGAFAGCIDVKKIVISDTVTCIESMAFMECDSLKEVVFTSGSSLIKIDKYAFAGCSNLVEVRLPSDISYIGRGAFIGCTKLNNLTFVSSANADRKEDVFAERVLFIEPECFAGCNNLRNIHFNGASLLSGIGKYAFYNCYSLDLIWIESAIEKIEKHAFEGCENISEIIMPRMYTINSIGEYAFAGCKKLKQFTFPADLTVLPEGIFKGCTSLSSCSIPSTVSRIEKYAFSNCTSLFSCVINNEDAKVSKKAFDKPTRIIYSKF